jgi:hypothetical protein
MARCGDEYDWYETKPGRHPAAFLTIDNRFSPRPMLSAVWAIVLLGITTVYGTSAGAADIVTSDDITLAYFSQVSCLDDELYQYHKDTVKSLPYAKQYALRLFTAHPEITAEQAVQTLEKLVFFDLYFDQLALLELMFELPGAGIEEGWRVLEQSSGLPFSARQAIVPLAGAKELSPPQLLELIAQLAKVGSSGHWAAQSIYSVNGLRGTQAIDAGRLLIAMNPNQQRLTEAAIDAAPIGAEGALAMASAITELADADITRLEALLAIRDGTNADPLFWLADYFRFAPQQRLAAFQTLSQAEKSLLLTALIDGADPVIERINHLHAITDQRGVEISTATLANTSPEHLTTLFNYLHPRAVARYQQDFSAALAVGARVAAITTLREATAFARIAVAEEQSVPELYALLCRGGELYDSSFRDVLIPVLQTRLQGQFDDNVLVFLETIDPAKRFVADFLVSCAQKGKLTTLLPADEASQQVIIGLLCESALANEESLILFAATFQTLLRSLQTPGRAFLIDTLLKAESGAPPLLSRQIRVILDHYRTIHPALLTETCKEKITELLAARGTVSIAPFITADFNHWKADGTLKSLSIFQDDDDGRYSYHTNCLHLADHGYRPRLSVQLSGESAVSTSGNQVQQIISRWPNRPDIIIDHLYPMLQISPLIVEWVKTVNAIECSHAVGFYQGEKRQATLLKRFFSHGYEMYAQRGHSYWRDEHLFDPLAALYEEGELSFTDMPAPRRFVSVGSCGGIRAYQELNSLFANRVDIFATVGIGRAAINNLFNRRLFEIVALADNTNDWREVAEDPTLLVPGATRDEYLMPGSLPAILYHMAAADEKTGARS